jgi:hypothetical protein
MALSRRSHAEHATVKSFLTSLESDPQVASDESFSKGIGGSKADHLAEKMM